MGIYPARKLVFIKAGIRVWRKIGKMGIYPARISVFIKAGIRVWRKIGIYLQRLSIVFIRSRL